MIDMRCYLLAVGILCGAAATATAGPPGWSRGQQELSISYEECLVRAPAALKAEGFKIDHEAGDFVVGLKDVHTAVIICSPAPASKMLVHIVVASNGEGGGSEREKLQARMDKPSAPTPAGDPLAGTWTWAYAPPDHPLEVHGTVTLKADGTSDDSHGNAGTWKRSGTTITLTWPSLKSVDTLVLSSDGKVMTGTNKDGWNIKGTKTGK
jgi:hypothetical protein